MCSILSILSSTKIPIELISTASKILKKTEYRGPDDQFSILCDEKLFMGSKRLAITDLSLRGRMPFKAIGSDHWIVFNGAIYNHKELRIELDAKGLSFLSKSDTEVVLNAYIYWGCAFINKLNGMFSFIIYDKNKNEVIVARDRFGIKSLFYTFVDNLIVYNSEFLPLKELHSKENVELNYSGLTAYMKCRFVPGNLTILQNIFKLQPAEIQITDLSDLSQKTHKYWKPMFHPVNYNQAEFNFHLDKAVKYSLEADVPPSLLLSGGLDSSAIAGVAHKFGKKNFPNFTCTFRDPVKLKEHDKLFTKITNQNIDESYFAQQISSKFNYELESFTIEQNIQEQSFYEMQAILGEPIASPNALGLFLFSKKLKGKTKLAINGTGADELLGGYQNLYFKNNNKNFETIEASKFLELFSDFDYGNVNPISFLNRKMFEPKYIENFSLNALLSIKKDNYPNERLNQLLLFELGLGLPGWELDQADRIFMKQSIELRPAFLENAFVDFCLSIPSTHKFEKQPLKKAMSGLLPSSIINRVKYPGLGTPKQIYKQQWFKQLVNNLFTSPSSIFDKVTLEEYRKTYKTEISFDVLFRLVYIDTWLKKMLNL